MSSRPVRFAAVGPGIGRIRWGFSALAVMAGMATSPAFWAQSMAGSNWEVSWGSQEPPDVDSPSVIYSVRLGPDGSWFDSQMNSLNSGWISAGPGDPNSTLGGGLYSSPNRGNSGNFVVVGTTPDGDIRYDISLDPGGLGGLPPPPPVFPPTPPPTSAPEVFIAPPDPAPEVRVQFGGEDWVRLHLKVVPGRTYQLLNSADLKKWVPLDEPFQATSDTVTSDFLTDRRRQFFRLDELQ